MRDVSTFVRAFVVVIVALVTLIAGVLRFAAAFALGVR